MKVNIFVGEFCFEENINYSGYDNNNGADILQPDAEHCRTFCRSNHPETIYFSWLSPTGSSWDVARKNECWCKTSNQGRTNENGITSGRVDCNDGKRG